MAGAADQWWLLAARPRQQKKGLRRDQPKKYSTIPTSNATPPLLFINTGELKHGNGFKYGHAAAFKPLPPPGRAPAQRERRGPFSNGRAAAKLPH